MENEQIKAFYDACQELKGSKIILADAKVSKVLRSIVSSPTLVEIVGDALVGFNLESEMNKCTSVDLEGNQHINLPAEPYRVIALVFSVLTEFDTRKLDLQEFVHQYFSAESLAESFHRFNDEMVDPFCEYLCDWVGFKTKKGEQKNMILDERIQDENDEILEEENEVNSVESLFEDLKIIFNQIKETIKLDTHIKPDRFDDLNITLDALITAIELKNFKILNALLISLNNLLAPIKSVRFYNMELQNRLASFYENYM